MVVDDVVVYTADEYPNAPSTMVVEVLLFLAPTKTQVDPLHAASSADVVM